jgi:hypothetical protein
LLSRIAKHANCSAILDSKSFAIRDSKKTNSFQSWINVPKLKSFLKILLSWIAKVLLLRIAKHANCSAILDSKSFAIRDSKKTNSFQSWINVPKLKSFLKILLSWIAKVLLSRIANIANCSAILDSKNCKLLCYPG